MRERIAMAWHVLRGRPGIYRVQFRGPIDVSGTSNVRLLDNTITTSWTGRGIDVRMTP